MQPEVVNVDLLWNSEYSVILIFGFHFRLLRLQKQQQGVLLY
jgi:hypothetical protein